jgi:protein-S-isoprenylcysteine O-methyltransferase Ste14
VNPRLRAVRLLLIPIALLALFSHHIYPEASVWDSLLGLSGLVLLLAAMGGRIWASAYIAGRKNDTLVTGGPYRLVRNPLYLFSLLGFIGAGLAFESLALACLFTVAFLISHMPAIRAEEQTLRSIFGEAYEAYERSVPRIIPSVRSFSRRPAATDRLIVNMPHFNAALRDCLAIPLVFVVADLLELAKLNEMVPIFFLLP